MKKLLLICFLMLTSCSQDPMDIELTATNRDEVVQKALPNMSDEEKKLLMQAAMASMMSGLGEAMGNALEAAASGKKAKIPEVGGGDWSLLPTGKSLNEILAEQKKSTP